jgi:hypothetical protein
MSFHKLSKEERAEWRTLPATKAALAFIRDTSRDKTAMALNSALGGDLAGSASHAGAQRALEIIADQLERD